MSEFNINQALRGISSRYTPAMREIQEEQNRVGRTVLNEARAQNQIALSREQANTVMRNLELAEQIPDPAVREQRVTLLTNRLGELMAQMGKFLDAVMITIDPERKKEFQEIADAFKADRQTRCDCPDEIIADRVRGTHIRQRSLRTIQKVINPATGQFVNFKKCSKCGHVTAG